MNITFLIGNGFDINVGLDTRYSDFYAHYLKIQSDDQIIKSFKRRIEEESLEKWSDLELEFGKDTKNLQTPEAFELVFDDLREKLARYISEEENKFNLELQDKTQLHDNFLYPERVLARGDGDEIRRFRDSFATVQNVAMYLTLSVNVITFNYSTVLEKLLAFEKGKISLISPPQVYASLEDIKHIHGYVDREMVLGVNDISQISNEKFRSNQDVLEALVKSEYNKGLKHLVDVDCKKIIEGSDLICLFGLSMGDTDSLWWEAIGQRLLTSQCRVIVFGYGGEISAILKNKELIEKRAIKNRFLSQAKISDEDRVKVEDRIFVGYNTNIFKIKVSKRGKQTK